MTILVQKLRSALVKTIALPSILLAMSTSCSVDDTDSDPMNVPGEDSSIPLTMGQGFNHLDLTAKGKCVKLGPLTRQSGQSSGQIAEYRLLEITSLTNLKESLNISASASLRGRGSARLNYANSINKNTTSRYLLVHTRVSNQMEIADDFSFTPDAEELLKKHGSGELFVKNCGTEFVVGRRTGGEFFALFEFESMSSAEEERFSAAMKVKAGLWKAKAEINRDISELNIQSRMQVHMIRSGGTGELPDAQNLEDFARAFPKLIEDAAKGAVTLELITKSYDGVKPFGLFGDTHRMDRQERVLSELSKSRDIATEKLNTIKLAQRNPDQFIVTGSLEKAESDLNAYINVLNDRAITCFENMFNGCNLPEVGFPSIAEPKRKVLAKRVSLSAINFTSHYLRHRDFVAVLNRFDPADLFAADSTFIKKTGLASNGCVSFESVNKPGFYLRHQDGKLRIDLSNDSELFKKDATFCERPGLANASYMSYESLNYPGYYLRHRDWIFYITQIHTDLDRNDATFIERNPNQG